MDATIQSIVFENVKFHSPITELKSNIDIEISISIQLASGKFEVCDDTTILTSGFVKCSKDPIPIRDAKTFYNKADFPILNSQDVYKEFRLRGYNYAGQFKSICKARMDGCFGQIKWENNNWTTFMDAMVQLLLLSKDTRSPYAPSEIRRIRINVSDHLNRLEPANDVNYTEKLFNVYHSSELSTIVCGGIEMSGVTFTSVERIEPDGLEVLQTYRFIPLMDAVVLDFNDAAGICIELALEKIQNDQVTLVEVLSSDSKPSIHCFYEVFRKTPLVYADLTLLPGDGDVDISLIDNESIKYERSSLEEYSDCTFIVMNRCMENDILLEMAKRSLSAEGYLILINDTHHNVTTTHGLTVISRIKCTGATFTLMQRTPFERKDDNLKAIRIDSDDEHFKWLKTVRETSASDNVLLIAQNDKISGMLGLMNCLRLEPDTRHFRCVIIEDEHAPSFDANIPLYKKQLALQLPINIYRNAEWGTYRHLELKETPVLCESSKRMTVDTQQVHGLRSLHWMPDAGLVGTSEIVKVQYATLNFCDRLIATGNLPSHTIIKSRFDEHRPLLGFEYAGITENKKRVMAVSLSGGSLSTHAYCANADFILEVTESMSLRDAATIPLAYFTVYCSFFLRNTIKCGQSILINDSCDSVGLAAIHVALAYGLKVFATVSTQQKKEFLLNEVPQLEGNVTAKGISHTITCNIYYCKGS